MKSSARQKNLCLFFLLICMACADKSGVSVPEPNGVQVQIEIPSLAETKADDAEDLSVLVFKENPDNHCEFFLREKGNWTKGPDNLGKTLLLPSGKYRFLLTSGSPFLQDDYTDFQVKTPLEDCFFSLPVSEGAMGESCGEFYMDDNTGGKTPWNEVYDCTRNTPQVIERTLTRAVGRVDVLVRRGRKASDGTITPVEEGSDMDIAYTNTLKKIKEIVITIRNAGSTYYLDGAYTGDPAVYSYVIKKEPGSSFFFTPFDAGAFEKLVSAQEGAYSWFDNYPYAKGPFLFPSMNGQNSKLEVKMCYTNFPEATYGSSIRIERNKVSLVTLWLLEEKLNLDVDLSVISEPLVDNESIGDNGIWD